jgi:Uma2 family endonuclease
MLVAEKLLTAKEYLELEKDSEVKHEFVHGNLIEMPGESKRANKIAGNLYAYLWSHLNDTFECFIEDVKVEIELDGIYRYPDVMVALASDDEDDYLVKMPVLLAEVVSPSSKLTDNGDKLVEYTSMSSTAYYLIIHQDEILVKFYRRNGDVWEFLYYNKPSDVIQLPALKTKIKLSEIYKKVDFA